MNAVIVGRQLAPEAERDARVTRWARETFESRLGLVIRRLADCPYLAGDRFTAADISVSYALLLGLRTGNYVPGSIEPRISLLRSERACAVGDTPGSRVARCLGLAGALGGIMVAGGL